MRVGIVTITELDNYGNRLQNYALQTVLQRFGCETETIPNYIVYRARKSAVYPLWAVMKSLLHRSADDIAALCRQKRFAAFDRRHIVFSKSSATLRHISAKLGRQYDLFICGSDQIWNPYFQFNFEFNFLTFAAPKKRVAYAASFGVEEIPQDKKAQFQAWIKGMEKISVREYAGQKIVRGLTQREAPVLPDPTLLLTKADWMALERRPQWISGAPYVLVYLLGDRARKTELMEKLRQRHPEYRDTPMIDLLEPGQWRRYATDPAEFLWLVHHAALMLTDSFHGTVFSLIFGTPFWIVERQDEHVSMQSRMQSLFAMLSLERKPGVQSLCQEEQEALVQAMAAGRRRAARYLKEAIVCSADVAEPSAEDAI